MTNLIAIATRWGPHYPATIARIWDAGDAFLPLDYKAPKFQTKQILNRLRPAAILHVDGTYEKLAGSIPLLEGDALVLPTSGSTGQPKGVIHTHDTIRASALATTKALAVDTDSDRWLSCLPLSHIGGLAVVLRAIVTNTDIEIQDSFDPTKVMQAAAQGANLVSLVTRALNQIQPASFRSVLIGGAAPPKALPSNVIATYGMTETGSGVLYQYPDGQQKLLDQVQLKLDTKGQIWLKGPTLFRAYRDATPEGHDPKTADGWFPSGDYGSYDTNSHLNISGRDTDLIITGGEKLWPAPIEKILLSRDDIAEVALIGIVDPDWGQRAVAAIVVNPGHSMPTIASLAETITQRFPKWSIPKQLFQYETLPKTTLGKLRRSSLTSDIVQRLQSNADPK